jgi:hypothetical protein
MRGIVTRHGRYACAFGGALRLTLVAQQPYHLWARTDEGDPRLRARLRKFGIFGEEPIARVYRLRARALGDL